MVSVESGKDNNPHAFGIFEVGKDNRVGLEPGDYLITDDILALDWAEQENDLRSPVRTRLAGWAQAASSAIGGPFSLTFKGGIQETGFALFRITHGRTEGRVLYWSNPNKDPIPPAIETKPSIRSTVHGLGSGIVFREVDPLNNPHLLG